jgi:hypothetical protein
LHFQRQSNNYRPEFTDQELMTIYLFGLLQGRFRLQATYDYIQQHWADWFPKLPSYQAVNYRLNQMGWHFEVLVDVLAARLQDWPALRDVCLTDSLPIILSKRPDSARVAYDVADKGYCATKKLYYHGFKLHLLATDRVGQMPLPELMQFSPASANDLTQLRTHLPYLRERALVADKAYRSLPLRQELAQHQQVILHTPVKLSKGQSRLDAADKLYSGYVCRMRQPIESLFNWLIDQTGIQNASKVRSQKGAILHCLGRLAAGLYILVFNS